MKEDCVAVVAFGFGVNMGRSSLDKKYDVFLNFRGDDTRRGFTSHLYNALNQRCINTYIDYKIARGEDVWPELVKAIKQSRVSIVVFSKDYASSTWCLKELVEILECRKEGQVVIPVFYDVDPSDIRGLSGSYGKAFAKHDRDQGQGDTDRQSYKQILLRWKDALKEAANISGWDCSHRDESLVIQNVVNDVMQKLYLRYPVELKGLFKNKKPYKQVKLLLKTTRVIGIWGMGGSGKSTIAKFLFAKLFPNYDNVCFMANSKEFSLAKLFFALFKEEVSTSNVVVSEFDMRKLQGKKVLIVLDDFDMDNADLLEFLYREYMCLHHDSKLIITTRDRKLLEERVSLIYKVKKWKNRESLKLFCLIAFNQRHPRKGYENLTDIAVKLAGGIPLALRVLGSHLRSRGIEVWGSTLTKLEKYPDKRIQNVLKVTYDELHYLEQDIFLDIAFFFKGKKKDNVISISNACEFCATSGIEILEDKALITISNSNTIQMHNLLQQVGLEIVRQECTANPGKRSRLKDNEAGEVIKKNTGTDAIHGITLDLSQMEDLALCADTFSKMKNLKILKLYNSLGKSSSNTYLNLPATLKPFSDQLRYIEWIGYPFEYIPSPFCTKFLVEIHMPQSKVKQLWQGIQELHNLEVIDLSECKQFEKLPNLSNAKKLKWVNLSGCGSLLHLHPSVLSSKTLVTLILDRCTKLKKVRGKKHLKHLQKISVNGCLNLEEFAVSSDLIENLDLSHTRIQTLDPSIQNMHNLKWLNLEGLRLKILIKEISCLTSLKELKISNSSLKIDKQRLHVLFKGLKSLEILYLQNCSNLFELPNNIDVLSQLKELRLDGSNVKNLPESIKNLQDLEILSLENCKGLECLPELPFGIKYLGVINCTSLELVSNLKSLATRMLGMTKRVTFKNSFKMDTHSLKHIMKGLYLTMMNAAIENVSVRTLGTINGYNYNSVELCLPGGKAPSIPWKINHRTTNLSITVKLPKPYKLLGFIYSVVLSPITGMKKHDCRITCKCYLPNEDMKEAWLDSDIGGLKSDHVYVWYDPLHCDNILKYNAPKVRFEFCVANNKGEVDSSICIKECGIRLIRVSNMFSILSELQLDSKNKKDLETREVVETGKRIIITSTKRSDEEENNDKRNQIGDQQRELSEYNSFDNIAGKKALERGKNSESDAEEPPKTSKKRKAQAELKSLAPSRKPKGSRHKRLKVEAKIRSHSPPASKDAEDISTPETEIAATEGNSQINLVEEEIPSNTPMTQKACARASNKQKTNKPKSLEAEKQPVTPENENIEIVKISSSHRPNSKPEVQKEIVNVFNVESSLRCLEDEHENTGQEELECSLNGNGCSPSKEIPEFVSNHPSTPTLTYNPEELKDLLNQVETDPFKMLKLFPGGTCMFSGPSKSSDENFNVALDEFRHLAFTGSLYRNLENPEYKRKVEAVSKRVVDFPQGRTPEMQNKVKVFMDLFNKAYSFYNSQQVMCDQFTQIINQRDADFNKLKTVNDQFNKIEETMNNRQLVIDEGKHQEEDIEEKINKLWDKLSKAKKERASLEVDQHMSDTAKNDCEQIAKQLSVNIVKSIEKECELKTTKDQQARDIIALEESYQQMQANPPF